MYRMLQQEMARRGYSFSNLTDEELIVDLRPEWFGDYEPTESAIELNTTRLIERTKP